jgi:hypothetical protein
MDPSLNSSVGSKPSVNAVACVPAGAPAAAMLLLLRVSRGVRGVSRGACAGLLLVLVLLLVRGLVGAACLHPQRCHSPLPVPGMQLRGARNCPGAHTRPSASNATVMRERR